MRLKSLTALALILLPQLVSSAILPEASSLQKRDEDLAFKGYPLRYSWNYFRSGTYAKPAEILDTLRAHKDCIVQTLKNLPLTPGNLAWANIGLPSNSESSNKVYIQFKMEIWKFDQDVYDRWIAQYLADTIYKLVGCERGGNCDDRMDGVTAWGFLVVEDQDGKGLHRFTVDPQYEDGKGERHCLTA